MVLLKIDSPSIAVAPFKGNCPWPINMEANPFRLSSQSMEIKTGDIKICQAFRNIQGRQTASTTLDQVSPYSTRIVVLEESGKSFMPEALDHTGSVT
jgi:hypothetical protein